MMVHETVAGGTQVETDGDLSGRGSVLVSAANGKAAERRLRRRRRKLAAATSTLLLAAAAVAGEPISLASSATQVAGGIGGGLKGMTDPGEVGASGRLHEDDKIGDYLLDADDPDSLLKLGGDGPSDDQLGIPATMYEAYMAAADTLAEAQPNCNLDWSLLASIGRIESNHARGGRVDSNGDTVSPILGPVLNGGGFAAIRDTDGGAFDGDNRWDRAVGAMQFIPSTWSAYKADGNDDGVMSPHNVFDATVAAGKYLCSGGLDMSKPQDRAAAVFRYNHSNSYVETVLLWADAYAEGVTPVEDDYVPDDDDIYALGPPSYPNTPTLPVPSQNPPQNPPQQPGNPPGTPPGTTTSTTSTTVPGPPTFSTTDGPTSTPCIPRPTTSTTTESTTPTTTSEPVPSESTTSTTPTTTSPSATPTPSC
jgi:hypothetical protein